MARKSLRVVAMMVATLLLAIGSATAGQAAERWIALVIGNAAYASVPKLANPQKDAETVAATLREIGFEQVKLLANANRAMLLDALRTFAEAAEGADWALIYYAGHGIEVSGTNYVLPVDSRVASDRDVQFEAVALPQLLASVEGARKLRLVILDACRDNPFLAQIKLSASTRSLRRGLARVEPSGGVLVAYAAKEGQVAMDGDAQSPFVASLVRNMRTPGLEINRLFRRVRTEVLGATDNRQEPFVYGSLPDEDFFFTRPRESAIPGTADGVSSPHQPDGATTRKPVDLPSVRGPATRADTPPGLGNEAG